LATTLVAMGGVVLLVTVVFALKRGQHRRALVAVEFA
jgi:hypothetical protein